MAASVAASRDLKESRSDSLDLRPVPDPTVLTTQQLGTAVASLKELFITRLDGMDKAIVLLQDQANRSPSINEVFLQHEEKIKGLSTHLDAALDQLDKLFAEKFASIVVQFRERDIRTDQVTSSSKVAVDAALSAQKEAASSQNQANAAAITKSEAAFTKQIDAIGTLIASTTKSADEKIGDIKDRITIIESKKVGGNESWSGMAAIAGLLLGLLAAVAAVAALMKH